MVLANNRLAVPPLQLEVGTLAEAVTVIAVGDLVATTQRRIRPFSIEEVGISLSRP